MKKPLFKLLKKAYVDKELLVEVKKELKAAGLLTDVSYFSDPFPNLIIGILSQNTSDANSVKAWVGLTKRFEITPQALAKADIKEVSKLILEKFAGDLSKLTKLSIVNQKTLNNLIIVLLF